MAAPSADLPPFARNQIAELQAEKAARTPAERKLDSQLIYALRQQRFGRVAAGLPRFSADLRLLPGDRVLVDMNAEVSAALLDTIANAGGRAVVSHALHRSIRAEVPLEAIDLLAMHPQVRSIRPADEATSNALVPTQGDVAHGADLVRNSVLVDGAGIKVGVLSDSAHYLTDLQTAGLLPPVTVLPGQFGVGSGEGTAMLQIVHQVAPGASLYFATAFLGIPSFAQNIRDLRAAGCQIIVDDVLYFRESPFQDGPIAQAVRDVCADGALYFSCAANGGNFNDGTSTTWRGDFVDGGETEMGRGGRVHLFGANAFNTVLNNPISSLIRADLFWADPLGQSTNDYDLYVLDSSNVVVRSSSNIQDGDDDPYEAVSTVRTGERLVIVKASGEARFLHLTTYGGRLAVSTSGSVRGHNAANAPNAFSVAATRAPFPETLFTGGAANPVEPFSCDGPRRIFFTPEGEPITPGNFTSTGGVVVNKPEITAADGVSTAVPGFSYFLGTSAAAPNAAAIAALLWSFDPSVAPEEISWALTTTALDIEAPGFDNDSGWGIVMAVSAADVLPGAAANLVVQNVTVTDANGNGSVDVNECADLTVVLKNTVSSLGDAATGIEAVLTTAVPGVRIDPEPRQFPDLEGQDSGTNSVAFRISTSPDFICGSDIECLLLVSTAEGKFFQRPIILNSAAGPVGEGVQVVSTNIPVPIPDLGFAESTVSVQGIGQQIADVVVSLFVTHTYDSDLTLSLIGPDGTSVLLVANNGGAGQNYGVSCLQPVVFSDASTDSILQGTAPFIGTFRPQEPLAIFRGKSGPEVNGIWKLRASDGAELDVGTIQCWSLNLVPYTCADGGGECLTPPIITGQPQSITTTNGETVQLEVAVTGTPPFFYQWIQGETNTIPGATGPGLVLENVQPSQAGAYVVIVSNYYGSVTSTLAQVEVLVPPTILASPADQVVTNGGTATFSVVAAGSEPLTYQWYFNETNLLSDATTADLILTNVTSAAAGNYAVTVNNSVGSVGSTVAILTVLEYPEITFEPQDLVTTNGGSAQFNVLAAGTEPLGYQWYFNGTNLLAGATSPTLDLLAVSPSEAGLYSVEVSNVIGVAWSRQAQLTVLSTPVVVQNPVDQVVTNGATVTFSVLVSGSEPLTYQWYFNETNLLNDATTTELVLSNVTSAAVGNYGVTVSNSLGSAASTLATLTVLDPPVITFEPQDVAVTNGDNAQFSVLANGTEPLSYQWYFDGTNLLDGATSPTLNLPAVGPTQTGPYSVEVSNEVAVVWSRQAQLTVHSAPVIVQGLVDQVATNGDTVTFSVLVTGSEPLIYQWFFNETNLLSDATTAELVLSNVTSTAAGNYGVAVSNFLGNAASTLATLTVVDPPVITFEPQDVAVTNGDDAQFSVIATGTEPLSYQWYFNGTNLLDGATSPGLELTAVGLNQTGLYSVEVSNGVAVVWSRQAQLTVHSTPVIVHGPVDQVATNGDTVTFSVLVTGSEPLVYQWFFNETNLLSDAIAAELILTNVTTAAAGTYSVTVSNLMGTAASPPATLVVLDPPVIAAEPQDAVVGIGDSVQFSVSATGTEPLSYQWYLDGTNLLIGATAPTLDLPTVSSSDAGLYSVEISNEVAVVWSRQAQLSVLSFPVIVQSPVDQVATNGDTVTFSVLVTGSEPLSYQWFFNETNLLSDATTAELVLSNVTLAVAGTYAVTVSNLLGSADSTPATLTVLEFPVITSEPQDMVVTNDHNAQFSVIATGTEPLTYRWYFNSSNLLAGSTSPTLDLVGVNLNQAGLYSVEVSNEVAVVWSRQAQLTVLSTPVIVQDPLSQVVTNGATVMFSVLATGSEPLIYQWFFNETNLLTDATTAELVLTNVTPTATGTYAVTVSNLMGFAASVSATLLVLDPAAITFEPQDAAVTNGDNAEFIVVATGTEPLAYQWYFNGSNLLVGETNSTLNLPSVNPSDAGLYSVEVSNEVAVVWSREARLTVLKNRQTLAPMIVENPASQVATNGDDVTFTVVASGSEPLSYQWFFNETNLLTGAVSESLLLTNVTSDVMGTYAVTVSNFVGVVSSLPATLVVLDPPVITSEPEDHVVATGNDAQFTVGAVGTEPLTYQWYFNGSNLLSGATGPTLDLSALSLSDAGFYSAAVSNEVAVVWSRQAMLAVLDPPAIVQSPVDQVATNGDTVTFSVMASGSESLAFQWYFAAASEMTGALGPAPAGLFDPTNRLIGATNAELVLDEVTLAATGVYAVAVSNFVGFANSLPASLVVLSVPEILSQPQSVAVLPGGSAQFAVVATGVPAPSYQWFFNETNLLSGATENLLMITNAQPEQVGSYVAVVSNSVGAVTSALAFLTIAHTPAILASPQNVTIRAGGTARFVVLAEGTGPLSFTWMLNETNFIATTPTGELSLTNVTGLHTGQYAAIVSNVVGSAISQPATLRVLVPPEITSFAPDELGALHISFSTWPGLRYTVEYKENLRDTTWIRLSGAEKMLGNGQPITVQDQNPAGTSRYYHVLVE